MLKEEYALDVRFVRVTFHERHRQLNFRVNVVVVLLLGRWEILGAFDLIYKRDYPAARRGDIARLPHLSR